MSDTLATAAPAAPSLEPYRHERRLFAIIATLSVVFWLLLTLSTLGTIWLYMLALYVFVLLAHSAFISHLKGNAVRIDAQQFPELHARIEACCRRIGVESPPEAYLMSGDGMLNAFATRFLRRYYVILLSDVIDALETDPEAINFYIGHELGHIARKHVANQWWMGPAMLLPVLGSAYRRAQEYTCDQFGAACCARLDSAGNAMAVLAAGTQRWKSLNTRAFISQCNDTGGFWMSLNELTSEYPWLCKRMARIHDPMARMPGRHPLAWLLALFLPGTGAGGLMFSMIIWLATIGILVSIAIPAYQGYLARAAASGFAYSESVRNASQKQYESGKGLPASPAELGLPTAPTSVKEIVMSQDDGQITVILRSGDNIVQRPYLDEDGEIGWNCATSVADTAIPDDVDCESTAEAVTSGGVHALFDKLLK